MAPNTKVDGDQDSSHVSFHLGLSALAGLNGVRAATIFRVPD